MTAMRRRICATIEARMTSTRLPGKILKDIVGKPALELMIERLARVPSLDGIIVATTSNATDDCVVALAERLGVDWFRGDEDDVLARVLGTARRHEVDVIVQTTGDCPLIDPVTVEAVIQSYLENDADYVSNILERSYPIGMDTQVFATDVLADVARRTAHPDDREHVSLYIYRHPELYSLKGVAAPAALCDPELRLTLDTAADLTLIRRIFEALYSTNPAFDLADILALLPELATTGSSVKARHG